MAGCSLWIACLLFLLVGPIAPVLCGGAQADVLATWEDPAGDDTGDGDYSYPSGRAFGDGGQADLLGFTIERDNGNLIFEFRLRRVVDPTEARSVPAMVAVAIDTQEGGTPSLDTTRTFTWNTRRSIRSSRQVCRPRSSTTPLSLLKQAHRL